MRSELLIVGIVFVLLGVMILAGAFNWQHHASHHNNQPTIAGLDVPAVHCQEDEVIGWIGVDTLGCINYEEVN